MHGKFPERSQETVTGKGNTGPRKRRENFTFHLNTLLPIESSKYIIDMRNTKIFYCS